LNKTQFLEFRTKNFLKDGVKTMSGQKYISNATEVNFLGLTLDSALSWKKHIDKLTGKLCTACYALRHIREVVLKDTLKSVYFAHIHSLLSYGIIFCTRQKDICYSKKECQNYNKVGNRTRRRTGEYNRRLHTIPETACTEKK